MSGHIYVSRHVKFKEFVLPIAEPKGALMQSSYVKNIDNSAPFFLPFNSSICVYVDDITDGPPGAPMNGNDSFHSSPHNILHSPVAVSSSSSSHRKFSSTDQPSITGTSNAAQNFVTYIPTGSTLVPTKFVLAKPYVSNNNDDTKHNSNQLVDQSSADHTSQVYPS